jgi:hypothetical protein
MGAVARRARSPAGDLQARIGQRLFACPRAKCQRGTFQKLGSDGMDFPS